MKVKPSLGLKVKKLLHYYKPYTLAFLSSLLLICFFFLGSLLFQSHPVDTWINPKEKAVPVGPSQKEISEKEKEKHHALVKQAQEKKREKEKNAPKKVPSDDPNVLAAYEGKWPPFKTQQEGDHWINFEEGSVDRQEIDAAGRAALNVKEELSDYWLSALDDQSIYLILTDDDHQHNYRIYMTFEDDQGWRVTRYEVLKEVTGEG